MIKKVEMKFNGQMLSLETGRMAGEAGGSVVVRLGDTMVLVTATMSSTQRSGIDFFPLLIDYEEKLYAAGKIPGGFFKREGRPTEKAILTARLIDRPIRPLFDSNFRNDVQVVATPLSVDNVNSPDVLAMIGASAALTISEIPFQGPAGAARVAKVDGKFIVFPTVEQMEKSDLDIIVAGTKDAIMMVEAGAKEVPESDLLKAIEMGHESIKEIVKLQEKLQKETGKKKVEPELYSPKPEIEKFVKESTTKAFEKALDITDQDEQKAEIDKIMKTLEEEIQNGSEEEIQNGSNDSLKELVKENPKDIEAVVKSIKKKIVRSMIVDKKKRPDGRKYDEIRPISCEVGFVPRTHGTGLFTRGTTQVLTIATLGSAADAQRIEGLEPEETKKRYMHHYNFPAFSVGEVRPLRGPGRREIGHGILAEKALTPVLPNEDKFPYALRLVSEVLASNGSTSMASTCASTLALMDAGVPISAPVAGVAMGLIKEDKKVAVLSDIQGIEDYLGDMDFKVTGTRKGVTAMQMDIKIKGISLDIMKTALEQAKKGRFHILDIIEKKIAAPRKELSEYAPRVIVLTIPVAKIGLVIGPGGKNIKKIIEESGAQVDINDEGKVFITTPEAEAAEKAKKAIEDLTFVPEVGKIYNGTVTRLMNFGAFVEIAPGTEGLVHISQLDSKRVARVEDVCREGDKFPVKVLEIDEKGRINLSKKAAKR